MKFWTLLLGAVLVLSTAPSAGAATVLSADSQDLETLARAIPTGETLELQNVPELGSSDRLILTRFEAFAPDAVLVSRDGQGTENFHPVPKNAYFQGRVDGDPGSRVVLSVLESGGMRGLVESQGRWWILAGGERAGGPVSGLAVREIDTATEMAAQAADFACATDELLPPPGAELAPTEGTAPAPPAATEGTPPTFTARAAFETDWEYLQLFGGDISDAIDYAGDLVAYASVVYSDEVDTSMLLQHLSLWTSPSDPWGQTSTTCNLFDFGRYWNDNRSEVDRTFAHFLSGRNLGGGIAWVGVLCSGAFNYNHGGACPSLSPNSDNYGGDYGFSAGLGGNFNLAIPTSVWDIVVTTHEIGHNFNSPHSHCYEGVGGSPSAVDQCYSGQCGQSGCYCGGTSLPGSGPGTGTIMSYCHLLGGGLGNISLTLGDGHPFGTAPERIPDRMNSHVVSRAGSFPGCLTYRDDLIFEDSFESGTSNWSENDPGGNLTTSGAAGIAPGSANGMAVSAASDDQTNAWVVDETPSDEPRYRVRFWYDPNSITMVDNKRHKIGFLFGTDPSQRRLLTFVVRKVPGGEYSILVKAHNDDDSWSKTAWTDLSDAPHMIEVEWRKATATGTNDGTLRFWLDGSLVETVSGIDNDGWLGEFFRLGNVGGLDVGTDGTQYFDGFVSNRMSYIGN
ncbi:MAG: M12 family metallo-peptidase [Acidobacteriota bacterium]|nr:M12 family metallo-peptidase [Acidobacteriota bacterium]